MSDTVEVSTPTVRTADQVSLIPSAEAGVGEQMFQQIRELYPICRSITGDGVRESLSLLKAELDLDLKVHEVPSGTAVLDWTVPDEWNIRAGYIERTNGERVIDFADHNLHVLNYSVPVDRVVSLEELREHLFSLPEHPQWIPYRTSYYNPNWGFCVTQQQADALTDSEYRVVIDSDLSAGSLTYGELFLPGRSTDTVLISCHICHPSLCNDNLSGIALATQLAQLLSTVETNLSYRFLFIPGTIGSITWLARNPERVSEIVAGLVVQCVGDSGPFTYKKSRRSDSLVDQAAMNVLATTAPEHRLIEFYPYGYDERQYCSPGFDLPVGSLSRTTHGDYPEYHTSADDLNFVKPVALEESLNAYLRVVDILENNDRYLNLSPHGEPQLGKRGLYGAVGALDRQPIDVMTILWVLNQSDGSQSLLDISNRSGTPFRDVLRAAVALQDAGLLAVQSGAAQA